MRHAGQLSQLRRGLCESVGQLMATQSQGRQAAVVSRKEITLRQADTPAHLTFSRRPATSARSETTAYLVHDISGTLVDTCGSIPAIRQRFLQEEDRLEGLRARIRQEVLAELLDVVNAFVELGV